MNGMVKALKELQIYHKLGESITMNIYDFFVCWNNSEEFKDHNNFLLRREIQSNLIMEKMDGDLNTFIKSGSFTKKHLLEILNLIKKMHEKEVVHFDLHLGNILFQKDKNNNQVHFRLTDFGMAHDYATVRNAFPRYNFTGKSFGGSFDSTYKLDFDHFLGDLKEKLGDQKYKELTKDLTFSDILL